MFGVTKFPSAYNIQTGEIIPFVKIRRQFLTAANDTNPKQAIKTLRESFQLACPHCKTAKLTFSFGSTRPDGSLARIAGSNLPGNPAHLKTLLGSEHSKGCIGVVIENESHEIDKNKGYRIHLNLKTIPERNPLNGQLIMRNRGGKIITLDLDLKGREPVDLSRVDKILALLRSVHKERLDDSVVIYGNQKINWNDFFVVADNNPNSKRNLQRVAQSLFRFMQQDRHHGHPILLDLPFNGSTVLTRYQDENGQARHYRFKPIEGIKINGISGDITIIPEMRVQNVHLFDRTQHLHKTHSEILALAEKPFLYKRDARTNVYMMVFSLRDPDMMVEAHLDDIMAISQKRSARQAATEPKHP